MISVTAANSSAPPPRDDSLRSRTVVDEAMSLPEDQRLEYALDILRLLTCDDKVMHGHLINTLQMTPIEAKIACYLAFRAGKLCTRAQILHAVYNDDVPDSMEVKGLDVFIHRLRSKHGLKIATIWGQGWIMEHECAQRILDMSETPTIDFEPYRERLTRELPQAIPLRWTEGDDKELHNLIFKTDSNIQVFEERLNRNKKNIRGRMFHLYGSRTLSKLRSDFRKDYRAQKAAAWEAVQAAWEAKSKAA